MAELEKGTEPNGGGPLGRTPSVDEERRKSNLVEILEGHAVNASGHEDELQRQYGIWSLCGLALTIDNAWVALGGSIIVASGKVTQLRPTFRSTLTLFSQRRSTRDFVRAASSNLLLLIYRRLYCRTRFRDPQFRRCLSLGQRYPRTAFWQSPRIFYWIPQLLWMDLRSCVHCSD